ncbi:hypothetical protein EBR43_07960 [bacterium]|nr:hypothetical protein [bacterium]
MTIEIDTLVETYMTLKEYIPSKERQGAADTLMSLMVDVLSDIDIKEFAAADSYLRRSFEEYKTEIDDDEDYTEEYED